jgi:hypothetical protein
VTGGDGLLGGDALLAQAPERVQEPGAERAVLVLVQYRARGVLTFRFACVCGGLPAHFVLPVRRVELPQPGREQSAVVHLVRSDRVQRKRPDGIEEHGRHGQAFGAGRPGDLTACAGGGDVAGHPHCRELGAAEAHAAGERRVPPLSSTAKMIPTVDIAVPSNEVV